MLDARTLSTFRERARDAGFDPTEQGVKTLVAASYRLARFAGPGHYSVRNCEHTRIRTCIEACRNEAFCHNPGSLEIGHGEIRC